MRDPLSEPAAQEARALLDGLTKPPGSLGRLEDLAAQLAGISGTCPPPNPRRPRVVVFAADHGVVGRGVGIWPQEITAAMVRTMAAEKAAVNAIARTVGAKVSVVDVGVSADLTDVENVVHAKVRLGTADLAAGPAMSFDEAVAAVAVGSDQARKAVAGGADCLVGGDMGIGNTTAATCLAAVFTGRHAAGLVGAGAGETSASRAEKEAVVAAAVERLGPATDPMHVLAEIGGLEIAALVGYFVAGVEARVPVVIDGAIAVAALLVAEALRPGLSRSCVAGHMSTEPTAAAGLEHLGMRPLVDLEMRLGEGTGACLAVPLLQAAAACLAEMGRLADLG